MSGQVPFNLMKPIRPNEDHISWRKRKFFFENHPFGRYWPFWIFRTGPLKSSLFLVGSIGYPDMWGVQNNLSVSHNYEKVWQDYHSFENHPFTFLALFGPFLIFMKGSFAIIIVSDWFIQVQKAPWHVRNPEHFESLQKPWNKCVKAAISFENNPFSPFWSLFWPLLTLITVSLKSSLSLIFSISYPYMWEA